MTIQEFILLDKAKVRRDSNLMHLYLGFFKEAFDRIPNCAGCSFATDWQKLINFHTGNKEKSVTLQKQKVMNTISIKKIQGKILAYKKDGKTYRQYDNILTDAFIKEYITNGTEEEIAERRKMFSFPIEVSEGKEVVFVEDAIKKEAYALLDEDMASENPKYITEPIIKKRGRKSKK